MKLNLIYEAKNVLLREITVGYRIMNGELKKYYLIEISDVNDKSNYFTDEGDFLVINSCIAKLSGLVAYCVTADNIKFLINSASLGSIANELSDVVKMYCEYYRLKYNKDNQILNIEPNISRLSSFDELLTASKDIHTTPEAWLHHPHSSIRAYLYDDVPEFIDKTHISNIYGSAVEYFEFLNK